MGADTPIDPMSIRTGAVGLTARGLRLEGRRTPEVRAGGRFRRAATVCIIGVVAWLFTISALVVVEMSEGCASVPGLTVSAGGYVRAPNGAPVSVCSPGWATTKLPEATRTASNAARPNVIDHHD